MDRRRDFDTWKLFCSVVRTGSVTRAAIEGGLDPAVVSRHISELEAACGEPLLNRRKRPITTTHKGEEFFEAVVPIVDAYAQFQEKVLPNNASVHRSTREEISISAFQGYGHECLPPLLKEYMAEHPQVSFRIYQEKSIDDLENGAVDIFVTASPVNRKSLLRYDTRLVLCIMACSRAYLAAYGVPKCPDDLRSHVGLERMGENFPVSRGLIFNSRLSHQAQFGQTIYSESSIALRDSAINGLGIVFDLPVEFMQKQILDGTLVQVLPGWHRRPFQRSVLVSKDAVKRRPSLQAFAEWLAEREREASLSRELRIFRALNVSPSEYR